MTKVSIIIPFYNRIAWLAEALQSVLNQTYPDFEILLIDDGSTERVENASLPEDRRIQYFRQENQGPAAARNRGIEAASGELIAFLDSDDVFLPNKLSTQIALMDAYPEIVFSHTSYMQMDALGETVGVVDSGVFSGKVYPDIITGCPIAMPTVMVRRDALGRDLRFDENLHIGEDTLLWIEIASRFPSIYGIREPLSKVRLHGKNAAFDPQSQINVQLRIREKVKHSLLNISWIERQELTSSLDLNIAYQYSLIGMKNLMFRYLLRSFFSWPVNKRYVQAFIRRIKQRFQTKNSC